MNATRAVKMKISARSDTDIIIDLEVSPDEGVRKVNRPVHVVELRQLSLVQAVREAFGLADWEMEVMFGEEPIFGEEDTFDDHGMEVIFASPRQS